MKTMLLILAVALNGFSAPVYSPTDPRAQVKPSLLPPLAPKLSRSKQAAAREAYVSNPAPRFLPAAFATTGVIYDIQVSVDGTVYLFGHQGAGTTLSLYRCSVQNPQPTAPWTIIGGADCYPTSQDFVFEYPGLASQFSRLFFKGENVPCQPAQAFAPTGALGAVRDLTIRTKRGTRKYRVADVTGLRVEGGGKVYKVLP